MSYPPNIDAMRLGRLSALLEDMKQTVLQLHDEFHDLTQENWQHILDGLFPANASLNTSAHARPAPTNAETQKRLVTLPRLNINLSQQNLVPTFPTSNSPPRVGEPTSTSPWLEPEFTSINTPSKRVREVTLEQEATPTKTKSRLSIRPAGTQKATPKRTPRHQSTSSQKTTPKQAWKQTLQDYIAPTQNHTPNIASTQPTTPQTSPVRSTTSDPEVPSTTRNKRVRIDYAIVERQEIKNILASTIDDPFVLLDESKLPVRPLQLGVWGPVSTKTIMNRPFGRGPVIRGVKEGPMPLKPAEEVPKAVGKKRERRRTLDGTDDNGESSAQATKKKTPEAQMITDKPSLSTPPAQSAPEVVTAEMEREAKRKADLRARHPDLYAASPIKKRRKDEGLEGSPVNTLMGTMATTQPPPTPSSKTLTVPPRVSHSMPIPADASIPKTPTRDLTTSVAQPKPATQIHQLLSSIPKSRQRDTQSVAQGTTAGSTPTRPDKGTQTHMLSPGGTAAQYPASMSPTSSSQWGVTDSSPATPTVHTYLDTSTFPPSRSLLAGLLGSTAHARPASRPAVPLSAAPWNPRGPSLPAVPTTNVGARQSGQSRREQGSEEGLGERDAGREASASCGYATESEGGDTGDVDGWEGGIVVQVGQRRAVSVISLGGSESGSEGDGE
ncbi:hypothetical protein M501DRAFT_1057956 [Patellaria atrata CBS 101060]|uniref:Uncharacterized protein n=1 Tax=Patellaria atrata CBS 101060 TaxID=1346257 RepID=A0A9P4VRB8_9PEZI|nr:hypothetical protein M501DRAFT_1057956 [Patellaria atrata CBS 101060]